MPISPTNISKTTITPTGVSRFGLTTWSDATATWADATDTWGDNYSVTNIYKNIPATVTTTIGSPIGLLLTLTYASVISGGAGWTNINKN